MTIYSLYIKVHRKTGLRYLGYSKKDPMTYQGSGVLWKKHLKEHGYDVDTTILIRTQFKKECNLWGRYYSKLYNIISAMDDYGNKIWANIIQETGGGSGDHNLGKRRTLEQKINIKNKTPVRKGEEHPIYDHTTYTWVNRETSEILELTRQQFIKKIGCSPGNVSQHLKGNRQFVNNWVALNATRYRGGKPKQVTGSKHPKYDHTVYEFVHNGGIREECTRQELITKYKLHSGRVCDLIHGRVKSTKGWKIIQSQTLT